ncbi:MAG: alpha amylase C-terminal domain-containing protein, partial [Verrucomicrobiales bacterium]|nr:alpha amylase C-terminal domain-containing protein [Verrucomicrobiales bacterium]
QLNIDQHNLSLMFERANLVFAFNFHPGHSVPDYALPLPDDLAGHSYTAALSTDAPNFGGHNRIDPTTTYPTTDNRLTLYLPSRTATVFARRPLEI